MIYSVMCMWCVTCWRSLYTLLVIHLELHLLKVTRMPCLLFLNAFPIFWHPDLSSTILASFTVIPQAYYRLWNVTWCIFNVEKHKNLHVSILCNLCQRKVQNIKNERVSAHWLTDSAATPKPYEFINTYTPVVF